MISSVHCKALALSPLFRGLEPEKISSFLESAGVYPRRLEKGGVVIEQGGSQTEVCVVLTGAARGERLTSGGNILTINTFLPGDVFGDILSGASEESPVSVLMSEAGEIISIPLSALIRGGNSSIEVRERVLRNLIGEIATKYIALMARVNLLTIPTLRGKIAVFLLNESDNSENTFTISHSREEQARLLGCDRSALSRELSRMRSEGIIGFHGRSFVIRDRRELEKYAQ